MATSGRHSLRRFVEAACKPSKRVLGYAATTIGAACLNGVFQAFYVQAFLSCWKLTDGWFYFGQTVFMLWNAINDPLFAMWQDKVGAASSDNIRSYSTAIFLGGPLFALSFLLPWFPWGDGTNETLVGIHFIVSLCFFDGMFTYVVLAQCGLFADVETSEEGRTKVLALNAVASVTGSMGLVIGFYMWNPCSFGTFRVYTVVVALISGACFYYTGVTGRGHSSPAPVVIEHLRAHPGASVADFEAATPPGTSTATDVADSVSSDSGAAHSFREGAKLFLEVVVNANFLRFVATNFAEVFNMTFNSSFYPMFIAHVLRGAVAPGTQSMVLGVGTVAAPFFTALLSSTIEPYFRSSYWLIRTLFVAKIVLAISVWITGEGVWMTLLLMLVHPPLSGATFSFFNMSISDLIDDDMRRNKRPRRMGTSFFGMNALFTKPAQSVAPMVIVATLRAHGFTSSSGEAFAGGSGAGATAGGGLVEGLLGGGEADPTTAAGPLSTSPEVSSTEADLSATMTRLIWLVPAVCGSFQLAMWSTYQLRNPAAPPLDTGVTESGSPVASWRPALAAAARADGPVGKSGASDAPTAQGRISDKGD